MLPGQSHVFAPFGILKDIIRLLSWYLNIILHIYYIFAYCSIQFNITSFFRTYEIFT